MATYRLDYESHPLYVRRDGKITGNIEEACDDISHRVKDIEDRETRMLVKTVQLLEHARRHHILTTFAVYVLLVLQLATFLSIGVVVWSQYYTLLKPLWQTVQHIMWDVNSLFPVFSNATAYVSPYLPNVPRYVSGYELALSQIGEVASTIKQAKSLAPFLLEVSEQYEKCAPLLNNVC
jgi:hypothetical protein